MTDPDRTETCPTCHGTGYETFRRTLGTSPGKHIDTWRVPCWTCGGDGWLAPPVDWGRELDRLAGGPRP